MNTPQVTRQRASNTTLAAISEKDIAEVAHFIAGQSGRPRETVESHLHWFLLENPVRQPADPLGFGLRAKDRLAGCILCVPQVFVFGTKKVVLMGSTSFYVHEQYRGYGGRLFLQYCRLGKRPLFGTSANAEAAALWKAAGANPITGSEGELFGVLHWPPVVEEFAHRRNSNRLLSRLAASAVSNLAGIFRPLKLARIERGASDSLKLLTSPEQVMDLPIHDPSTTLTAMRNLPYIRWRYFSGKDVTVAVFAFRSQQPCREILVTVNQRSRGYRGQINTLNILDVYPQVPGEEWLRIVGALIHRFNKTVDAVVLRSQNPERQKLFREIGFQARTFDAPNGWFLDKANLLPTHHWYPVPADGDCLI